MRRREFIAAARIRRGNVFRKELVQAIEIAATPLVWVTAESARECASSARSAKSEFPWATNRQATAGAPQNSVLAFVPARGDLPDWLAPFEKIFRFVVW